MGLALRVVVAVMMGAAPLGGAVANEPPRDQPHADQPRTDQPRADPPRVTSHSPEYCAILVRRVDILLITALQPPPQDAVELAGEGRRLCDQGHVRGGIMRLRMALMLLRPQPEAR